MSDLKKHFILLINLYKLFRKDLQIGENHFPNLIIDSLKFEKKSPKYLEQIQVLKTENGVNFLAYGQPKQGYIFQLKETTDTKYQEMKKRFKINT